MRKIFFFCFLLVLFASLVLTGCANKTGKYDSFAQCLTEKNVKMYGTDWCSYCQNQKKAFGSSFQYINYTDCDKYRQECLDAGVEGYPTWIINGDKYSGEQTLYRLASLTNCSLEQLPIKDEVNQ